MSKPSSLLIKAAVVAVALLISLLLWWAGFFDPLDLYLYDSGLRYRVDHNPQRQNILKIVLDDSSEEALGERLDSRESFGDVLTILGTYGAAAGLDFVFPRPNAGDRDMARAAFSFYTLVYAVIPVPEGLEAHSPVIDEKNQALLKEKLWHIKGDTEKIPKALSFIMSNPEISASATMLGHIGVYPDKDGVYRRVPVFYRWEDGVIPSMPLAMAVSEMGIPPEDLEFRPGKGLIIPMGGEQKPLVIPCDDQGYLLIPYGSRWYTDQYRKSFSNLIADDDPDSGINLLDELSGTITMLADTTSAKQDFGITPFETFFPRAGIHTAVLSGILNDFFYTENSLVFKAALVLLLFALLLLLSFPEKDVFFHSGHAVLLAGFCFFSFALWNWGNRLPWFCVPAFLIISAWGLGFVRRLFVHYREQLLYKTALTRYFPRSLAERIAAEGKTELIPAHKELTMLFADIVSFTRWSSDKEAGDVHAFLSDYLESMAEILFANGGTVDKFIGDGILAFFGDPVEQPDHAVRCVTAAVQMQKKARELAEKWRHAGIDLKIRIGINSGTVIAGNLGTKTRIEYTVIGSAVNLAQRMESNAPQGGILVAEATWEKTKNYFTFSEKRDISVKGYDVPIFAWEIAQN